MPVIKLFTTERPSAVAASALAVELETLCTRELHAQSDAIQVILQTGAVVLRGAALFAEVHYRDRPERDADALARFMDGLNASCQRHVGQTPRIRCFAVDQSTLFARG